MTDRHREVDAIFREVCEVPAADWDGLVAARCGEDEELLGECRALLRAFRAMPDGFLEPPEAEAVASPLPGITRLSGHRIGAYLLEECLGSGGMATVYRAERDDGTAVAIKILPHYYATRPELVERFRREVNAASRLDHPNIVGILGAGENDEGTPYFAMQLIDGTSLQALKPAIFRGEDSRFPDTAHLVRCIEAVARALHHAHGKRVLHRDVKPHNILIDRDGKPFLADFGLAKDLLEESMSGSRDLKGSIDYMSPEQARAIPDAIDHRTDIYSLGAVLYELLCHRRVFEGEDETAVLRQLGTERPRRLRKVNPDVPRDLELVCMQALRRRPKDRYATAEEFADDLARWLRGERVRATRELRPPAWLLDRRALLVAVPALLAAGGGLGLWLSRDVVAPVALRIALPPGGSSVEVLRCDRLGEPLPERPYHSAPAEGPAHTLSLPPGDYRIRVWPGAGELREFTRLGLKSAETLDASGGRMPFGEMVDVPGGEHHIQILNEKHTAVLGKFRIDRRLATNGEFEAFLLDHDRAAHAEWAGVKQRARELCEQRGVEWSELPAHGMSFELARAYAEHRGKRLPTALEWHLAVTRNGADWFAEHLEERFPRGSSTRFNLDFYKRLEPGAGDALRDPNGLEQTLGPFPQWTLGTLMIGNTLLRFAGGVHFGTPIEAVRKDPFPVSPHAADRPGNLGIRCVQSLR